MTNVYKNLGSSSQSEDASFQNKTSFQLKSLYEDVFIVK